MKILLLTIFSLSAFNLSGQNGYIKLNDDSTLVGYLRYYVSNSDGNLGIEFWRTKKDKEPLKVSRESITEYAIKTDTFKVLHQFKPFHDSETFFELVDAKLELRGKVNLYIIENYRNLNRVTTYTGGGLIPAIIDASMGNYIYMYILEDRRTGFLKALPSDKEKLKEALKDVFPEKYVVKYDEVKGEINYRSVPDLVKLYNSK